MARLYWYSSAGFNLRDFDVHNFNSASSSTTTPTSYSASYASGYRDDFTGHDFTYDVDGTPTGGVVARYATFLSGKKLGLVDGLSVSIQSLIAAARTETSSDDFTIYRAAFAGRDQLNGGTGRDVLEGFAGNDRIAGGTGADALYGGLGADRFVFTSIKDSRVAASGRDTIYDFSAKQKDKIDLTAIDANTHLSGNQRFTYIGDDAFSHTAGELRYTRTKGHTYVQGDVNGDGVADFSIHLKGTPHLAKGDFYL